MKLLDLIVCDDIRQESGNKMSLMGVYGSDIVLHRPPSGDLKWPVTLRLGFFIRFLMEPSETPDAFLVEFIQDATVTNRVQGVVHPSPDNLLTLALVNPLFSLKGVGSTSLRIVLSKEGKVVSQTEPEYGITVQAK